MDEEQAYYFIIIIQFLYNIFPHFMSRKYFLGNLYFLCFRSIFGMSNPTETKVYNPMKSNYHPIKDASWDKGER